jgi:tryptophanyl-tRNA synthetase
VGDEWFTQTAVTKTVQERHAYYFIADYHALTTIFDPKLLAFYTRSVTATWLACGLDLDVAMFYRRSDVPGDVRADVNSRLRHSQGPDEADARIRAAVGIG